MGIIYYLNTIKRALEKLRSPPEKELREEWVDRMQLFMKEGACKDTFVDFQDCVDEECTDRCFVKLQKCMEAHSNYYQPILAGEKIIEEEMMKAIMPSTISLNEKEQEQAAERFISQMEGGGCRESFKAWQNCMKNKKDFDGKCSRLFARWDKCMEAHSDYNQPYLAAKKSIEDRYAKEIKAFFEG